MFKKRKLSTLTGIKPVTGFASSILKKQFRFDDWLAEKVIKTVAFMSITFVILIFVFVFRETLPIFGSGHRQDAASSTQLSAGDESFVPETYDPGGAESAPVLEPENYGVEVEDLSSVPDSGIPDEQVLSVAEPVNVISHILYKGLASGI